MAAYVAGLAAASGRPVARAVLLFLSHTGATGRHVQDLAADEAQLRERIRGLTTEARSELNQEPRVESLGFNAGSLDAIHPIAAKLTTVIDHEE